jgi:adenylate cyclase
LFPYIEHSEIPWRLLDSVAVKGKKTGVKIYACNRRLSDAEHKGWNLHNTAMHSYYNRDFSQAIEQFMEVLSLVPEDPNALMILERCQRYKDAPPPEGWDGVEVLTSK